ncbi:MAG: hypothetical protein WDA75_04840, partial [Candidatus Latescibacterota bacterium]
MAPLSARPVARTALVFLAAAALGFWSGCDQAISPLSPDPVAVTQAQEGTTAAAPSPQGAQPAAKLVDLIVSKLFSLLGGAFTVTQLNDPGVADDVRVTFSVPRLGLALPTLISMRVS